MNLQGYFLLFMIYSFLGWVVEMIFTSIDEKKVYNRGFLIGPYCPIYGYGCLAITILLKPYIDRPLGLFVMAIVICSILEYFTSYIMEKIFKARWWDYSDKKFNINGRICLETMLPFGVGGTIIMYYINPFFVKLIIGLSPVALNIISIILFVIYLLDNLFSLKVTTSIKKSLLSPKLDDTIVIKEEMMNKLKESIDKTKKKQSYFVKRIYNAFPNLKKLVKKVGEKDEK